MSDDAGIIDAPIDSGAEVESGAPEVQAQPEGQTAEKEFGSKSYRDFLKSVRENFKDNPLAAQAYKRAYDHEGRFEAITALEPKGIDGIRDTYTLINSVGGIEGITQLQTRAAEQEQLDSLFQNGDPKALESLPKEWDQGLAKLAPSILDRVASADPAAYSAAILPHLMNGLLAGANTPGQLVHSLNSMIDDIMNGAYDDKTKLQKMQAHLSKAAGWFETQQQRAASLKQAPQVNSESQKLQTERAEFEKQRQDHHWNTNIDPPVAQYEQSTIDRLLKPYQDRLKLDNAALADLKESIGRKMGALGKDDKDFSKTFFLYKNQKSPDPKAVVDFMKHNIDKHAKSAVDAMVTGRYGFVLNSRPGPKPGQKTGNPATAPAPAGHKVTRVVTQKPDVGQIDYQRSKKIPDFSYKGLYYLKSGELIQVQRQR